MKPRKIVTLCSTTIGALCGCMAVYSDELRVPSTKQCGASDHDPSGCQQLGLLYSGPQIDVRIYCSIFGSLCVAGLCF